jgi:Protein of unknown function (Hypoth_ymh).
MDAKKNPQYLRTVQAGVSQFIDALNHFMTLHTLNTFARGTLPAVFPNDDADAVAVREAREAVDKASGQAVTATALTGCYYMVEGAGKIDPIAAWHTITQPKPLLEPSNILSACSQMLGRLDALIARAEAEASPSIDAEAMHPLVWGAARPLWHIGKYRQAVAAAGEALAGQLKARTGRNNTSETSLWQETFGTAEPTAKAPRLRWPGDDDDRNVRSMREGLRQFAPGVQMTIRNIAQHTTGEFEEHEALEQLAALSLLARWAEQCVLLEYSDK